MSKLNEIFIDTPQMCNLGTDMLSQLRLKLNNARKACNTDEMSILQVLIGEITTLEARNNKITDEECEKIIRKVIESNNQTIKLKESDRLSWENEYLNKLLPKTLTVDEIKEKIVDQIEFLKAAKSDGQAMGLVMKYFKTTDFKVLGDDVNTAVKQLRAM